MLRCRSFAALLLLVALATSACERAKSANPVSPDVAGPIPGVAITAPKPLQPAQGAEVVYDGAPLTLMAENASTNGQRALFMQIELAADAGFQQVVHQADRVEMGSNGRTAYRMPEPLGAGYTYYWRARALDGANTGPYSFVSQFSVVDPVVIETPIPLEPLGNLATNRPQFRVRNGRIEGTTGVYYRFELATAPDPASTVAVMTVSPGSNGETTVSLGDLPYDRTFYWRVHGSDGTHQSFHSAVVSFRTSAAPAPPTPIPAPPGPPSPSPLPGGGGGRTPDPAPGQRLPLPNMFSVVEQVAAAMGNLDAASCNSWYFLDTLVDTLRTYDTRWGYNWKRGNVGDPSHDVVDYHWGAGPDEGSTEVYIIDVIGAHCTPGASAAWTDVTAATYGNGGVGRWTGRGRF